MQASDTLTNTDTVGKIGTFRGEQSYQIPRKGTDCTPEAIRYRSGNKYRRFPRYSHKIKKGAAFVADNRTQRKQTLLLLRF